MDLFEKMSELSLKQWVVFLGLIVLILAISLVSWYLVVLGVSWLGAHLGVVYLTANQEYFIAIVLWLFVLLVDGKS